MYWREDAKMWWPDCELERVYKWMADRIDSVDKVMRHVGKNPRCCIQAGGYIGMWPVALAKYFAYVHTFEPVPELHDVLVKNTEHRSQITVHRQALGERCGATQLAFRHGGRSILNFNADKSAAIINTYMVTIDSLNLTDVSLIYLDTERSELDILRGATETIKRDKPVIALEILDGQDEEYDSFMRKLRYERIAITHRDAIYANRK